MKKISYLLIMLLLMLASFTAGLEYPRGDVDHDGQVSISDVTTLIDYLLTSEWPEDETQVETFMVNGVLFNMVAVEGGTFTMGSTAEQGDDGDDDENPSHQVTLSSYSIGETEVTQALWKAVMETNPSQHTGDLNRPVEDVTWNDCQEFITKLNQMTGRTFRLPTEAEWEFAARGGNKCQFYKYAGGNTIDEVAWYYENSYAVGWDSPDYGTHAVATKSPNELGLYDMSGNVWEWCNDKYGEYTSEAQTNPTGPTTNTPYRVRRGGAWGFNAKDCRVSCRGYNGLNDARPYIGLRLAL